MTGAGAASGEPAAYIGRAGSFRWRAGSIVSISSCLAFLNSRIARPRLRPISGSLLGPKMISATTRTINQCDGLAKPISILLAPSGALLKFRPWGRVAGAAAEWAPWTVRRERGGG